ncbi:MAG: hypothetical protein WCP97_00910 [bacterium]
MDKNKIEIVRSLLVNAETNIAQAKELLNQILGGTATGPPEEIDYQSNGKLQLSDLSMSEDGKVIEGVFDGESMYGPDKKKYSVPPNYASKSKLVYGDKLKLIIGPDGTFTYKQIGPVDRKFTTGVLVQDGKTYKVAVANKQYRVLAASVSYYRAQVGDEVAIIIPSTFNSEWATIENLIPRSSSSNDEHSSGSSHTTSKAHEEDGEGSPFEIPKTLFSRKKTVV